jgi:hypothetical protein
VNVNRMYIFKEVKESLLAVLCLDLIGSGFYFLP